MRSERKHIQNAFLDGINEIFTTMFTDQIEVFLLDEENTKTNVYKETANKKYLEPVRVAGEINTTFAQGENVVEGIEIDALIRVPTKQIQASGIPHETLEDLETLRKSKVRFAGVEYLVHKVTPKTLIAEIWHFYDFACLVDKNVSVKR